MSEHGHYDEGQLLRYADGELPPREAKAVHTHLNLCWQCRAELDRLQHAIADAVEYSRFLQTECTPPPPKPWFDLPEACAEQDRIERPQSSWHWPRWAAAAAALATLVVLIQQFLFVPPAQAAQLLSRATEAESRRPAGLHKRIEIRSRTRHFVRPVGLAAVSTDREMEERFRQARYNWQDPLSAHAYVDWRKGLDRLHDEVVTIGGTSSAPERLYRIRTTTQSGTLAAASLTLRASDLHPVSGLLEFRDQESISITEAAAEPAPIASLVNEAPASSGLRPAAVPLPAETEATAGDELDVLAALHQLGADLGEPLEIARSGGRVVVTGSGISAARQDEIRRALEELPKAETRFSGSLPSASPARTAPAGVAGPVRNDPVQTQLEAKLGGRAAFVRVADDVLQASERLLARAHALQRLADHFSPAVEAQLSPEDQARLRALRQVHSAALRQEAQAIAVELGPALPRLPVAHVTVPATSWQTAAGTLLATARDCDRRLGTLLAGTSGDEPEALARLSSALAELASNVLN